MEFQVLADSQKFKLTSGGGARSVFSTKNSFRLCAFASLREIQILHLSKP
jgi:hypothetical protein